MRNRIGNTSSYYSAHAPSQSSGTRSSTSGSERSFQTSAPLSHFASRLSAAGEARSEASLAPTEYGYGYGYASVPSTYGSDHGSAASSVYESATASSLSGVRSDIGSTHSGSSDLFEVELNRSARRSAASSDLFELDFHGIGRSSTAGGHRRSDVAGDLSQAGTPTERSFHLSERDSVASALHNGRLGYSSASSRRLASYEASSRASSATANSAAGSVVSSYHDSLTPSDRSALLAARGLGRFIPADLPSIESSLDSDYAVYLREGDDVVAPLRTSQLNPAQSATPSDPYSVSSGSVSRRLDRAPSFSRRIDDNHRPNVDSDWSSHFGGADIESLAAAGTGFAAEREHRQLWELLQDDH